MKSSMGKKILIRLVIVAIPIRIYTPLFISAIVNEPSPAATSVPAEKPLSGNFTGAHDGFHNAGGNIKVVSLTGSY